MDLDTLKYLQFHFVFDHYFGGYGDIFEAVEAEILDRAGSIEESFDFAYPKESREFLMRLARGDRKRFVATKHLPRHLGSQIVAELVCKKYIEIEKSKEPKPQKSKYQKLKKELRRYQIQDKIHFKSHFYRFWFRFIEPNLDMLKSDKKGLIELIKSEFDHFCSLEFELASIELLSRTLNIDKSYISSYWDKECEIDIYANFDGYVVVAEAKYKDRKVCKNILNLLEMKCEKSGIKWDKIALFSKSGFSNELRELKSDKIMLFELDDFKEIYG